MAALVAIRSHPKFRQLYLNLRAGVEAQGLG
jgi:hypothetical protein